MARPRKPLDLEQVIKLASKLWTDEMIGAFFDVSCQTVRRRYGKEIDAARQTGKSKLVDIMWARVTGQSLKQGEQYDKRGSSDTVLLHALDRYLGKTPTKLELNDELVDAYINQKQAADTNAESIPGKKEE